MKLDPNFLLGFFNRLKTASPSLYDKLANLRFSLSSPAGPRSGWAAQMAGPDVRSALAQSIRGLRAAGQQFPIAPNFAKATPAVTSTAPAAKPTTTPMPQLDPLPANVK